MLIAFFDIKKCDGALQVGVEVITSDTLFDIESMIAFIRPDEEYLAKNPRSWLRGAPTFKDVSARIYRRLNGKVWMGHDIVKVDIPNLMAEFDRIKEEPPKPAYVIDAVHFTDSGTELAKAALKLGLGSTACGSVEAIKRCRSMMPPLESNSDDDDMDYVVALIKSYDDKAGATSRLSKLSLSGDAGSFSN